MMSSDERSSARAMPSPAADAGQQVTSRNGGQRQHHHHHQQQQQQMNTENVQQSHGHQRRHHHPQQPVPADELNLYELREMARRQHEHIETQQRLVAAREQKLKFLKSQSCSMRVSEKEEKLSKLKESVSSQEVKLRQLRAIRGQVQHEKGRNLTLCEELNALRVVFGEKEKELSVAVAKIDALTRQLEELKTGNTTNSYNINGINANATSYINSGSNFVEIEKLRQELLYRHKVSDQAGTELTRKRELNIERQSQLNSIDERIAELQTRLAKKRLINEQLSSQIHSHLTRANSQGPPNDVGGHGLGTAQGTFRSSIVRAGQVPRVTHSTRPLSANIAAVEPVQRHQQATTSTSECKDTSHINDKPTDFANDFVGTKYDPKYQTLPHNTKFGPKNHATQTENHSQKAIRLNSSRSAGNVKIGHDQTMNFSKTVTVSTSTTKYLVGKHLMDDRPSPSGSSTGSSAGSPATGFNSNTETMAVNNALQPVTPPPPPPQPPVTLPKPKPSIPVKPVPPPRLTPNSTPNQANGGVGEDFVDHVRLSSGQGVNHATDSETESNVFSNGSSVLSRCISGKSWTYEPKISSLLANRDFKHVPSQGSDNEEKVKPGHYSMSQTADWHKIKRRPVIVDNEMEKELSAVMTGELNTLTLSGDDLQSLASSSSTSSCASQLDSLEDPKDLISPGKSDEPVTDETVAESVSIDTTLSEKEQKSESISATSSLVSSLALSGVRRTRGGLKSRVEKPNDKAMRRRVSFDPLALLLDAALEGEFELVKKTSGEVPNASACNDEGITALHNAICAGHFDIVTYLVEIGCDVNAQDSDGWTPLHCAASCNNLAMVKFLVEHGACIFACTLSDHETAAEKCEEDEEGFDGCSQYLYGIEENIGLINDGLAYAVYDYEAQNSDELTFNDGNAIRILKRGDDQEKDWWWAKHGDAEGYVPSNLLGLYPRVGKKKANEKID